VAAARIVVPKPVFRKLRVFGVDPDVAVRFETAFLNEVTLRVHWEDLEPGPSGEYIRVVDVNEHGDLVHPPIDLDHPDLRAQDVIAHELTHAILMGMNIAFNPGKNPDILAFHEAFADLVPLFQHFWLSDVLRQQIAAVRGNLREPSALGAVALQFGRALGRPDGIRNAFGKTDAQGRWQARQPDPKAYKDVMEPHDRGDILVGAIFEAFNKVYESRTADLRRIATRGTGVL